MKTRPLLLLLLGGAAAFGQMSNNPPDDSTLLRAQAVMEIVTEHHPVARQARLRLEGADAEALKSKGGFDPKLFSEMEQKYFQEKNYYWLHQSGVQIPTNFALQFKAGYQQHRGVFLNPENQLPATGLYFLEAELPLLQGLFIDERRAAFRKARLLQDASLEEARWAINKLLIESLAAYWQWYQRFQTAQTFQDALATATERLVAVKKRVATGEKAAIDTLEATIQRQDRYLKWQNARDQAQKARRNLENYLWLEGSVPLELNSQTSPAYQPPSLLPPDADTLLAGHPRLNVLEAKRQMADVDRRWAVEQFKPQLDLRYKLLSQPAPAAELWQQYNPDNYTWGFSASFPLFLRKARGAQQKAQVKMNTLQLKRQQKRRELTNKLRALRRSYQLQAQQVQEARQMANNYRELAAAEREKFAVGESSLFLINSRELKYLQSLQKVWQLHNKFHSTRNEYLGTAALLYP